MNDCPVEPSGKEKREDKCGFTLDGNVIEYTIHILNNKRNEPLRLKIGK